MNPALTLFAMAALVWFVTTIIVEGEILFEVRDWITEHAPDKVGYLVHCHMCAGTWVGLGVGFIHPLHGLNPVFSGLAYKAVAHLILGMSNLLERCAR